MIHRFSTIGSDSFASDHVVAKSSETLCWSDLWGAIDATIAGIESNQGSAWALYEPDTYRFLIGLLALLTLGKHVYLPGDNSSGIAAKLFSEGVSLLGEFPGKKSHIIAEGGPACRQHSHLQGSLQIYTSGSTGEPKVIAKSLTQLDKELQTLEGQWGDLLDQSTILSTVSHQHFYGFLFAALWPLCSGRAFWRRPLIDPVILGLHSVKEQRAAWVMSPAHLHRIGNNMPWADLYGRISTIFSSGGPLQQASAEHVIRQAKVPIQEVFGSSETGAVAYRERGSVETNWVPLAGVEVAVNADSHLIVRSPYTSNSDWLVLADTAKLLPNNIFQLGPRSDRIVKIEGKRVSLPQIEILLQNISLIKEAAAVVLHGKRTIIGAVIELSLEGQAIFSAGGKKGVISGVRPEIANYLPAVAIPRSWRLVNELPRNPQGKITSNALRELFE